jgi:hypothetical protein
VLTIHPIRRPPPTYDVPLCVQMDGCQTVPEMEILNKCCYRKAAGDVAHPLAVREGLRHRAQADQSHKGGREVVDRPAVEPINCLAKRGSECRRQLVSEWKRRTGPAPAVQLSLAAPPKHDPGQSVVTIANASAKRTWRELQVLHSEAAMYCQKANSRPGD